MEFGQDILGLLEASPVQAAPSRTPVASSGASARTDVAQSGP